jgi:hypothetical protein
MAAHFTVLGSRLSHRDQLTRPEHFFWNTMAFLKQG